MAYLLSRRTSELGIRMALGARPGHIKWLALRETLLLAFAGSALGVGTAVVATRYVSSMLYEVNPVESSTVVGCTLMLSVVARIPAGPARLAH